MKKTKSCAWPLLSFIGIILMMSGCTKSISVNYNEDMPRLSNADSIGGISLGIAKFDDNRPWVDKNDVKSESYIAMQSPWKFGLSYQGKDYVPVKDIVQTIFVKEFLNAGIKAKPIDQIISKKNIVDVGKMPDGNKADYLLGGEILIFEFVNDAGVWTVESRRTIALNLIMVKSNGQTVCLETNFNETDRENEGMAVLHETNVDKLMNKVAKKVFHQVIKQVSEKMALNYKDISWKISLNGKAYDPALIRL